MIDGHILLSLLMNPVKPAQLSADGGNTSAAASTGGGQVPGSRFRLSNAKVKALTARRCGGHRRNNVANEKSRGEGRKEAGSCPWTHGSMEPLPSSQMGLALVGPPLRYSQHSLLPLLNPQTWPKQTTAAALPGLIQQLFLAKASFPFRLHHG